MKFKIGIPLSKDWWIWLNRDENGEIEDPQITIRKIDNGEIYKAEIESDPFVNGLYRRMKARGLLSQELSNGYDLCKP